MGLIVWLLVGLFAGAVARLLVPGRDRLGFAGTLLLGVAGSFVGGILGSLVTDDELRISRGSAAVPALSERQVRAVSRPRVPRRATVRSRRPTPGERGTRQAANRATLPDLTSKERL